MLIFKESGRLGNQIFQYAALKTLCKNGETLVILGFEDLQTAFNGIDAKIINSHSPRWERSLYYRLYRIGESLSQKKIVTRIEESKELPQVIYNRGLLKRLVFVAESYFQSEPFFKREVITSLTLKPQLLASAQKLLNRITNGKIPIFVHIRRGDYLRWPNKEYPAVLPASYYQKCIHILQSKIQNPFFIFTSDDPFYVKDVFGDLKNSYIAQGSSMEDFALMTQCQGGILSASSFAWWAAYFAHVNHGEGIFIAPKYWGGHRLGYWYPRYIESNLLTYELLP